MSGVKQGRVGREVLDALRASGPRVVIRSGSEPTGQGRVSRGRVSRG